MTSREKILNNVRANAPLLPQLDEQVIERTQFENNVEKFKNTLVSIGGAVLEAKTLEDVQRFVESSYSNADEVVVHLPSHGNTTGQNVLKPHDLSNVKLAVLEGKFGVAENASIWVTDETLPDRALPFICENLILVIKRERIVATMHEAYETIGDASHNFATFIAGPSKTADIEQSLVLGAHGPKSLTVFLI